MEYYTFENGVKLPLIGMGTYPLTGDVLKMSMLSAYKIGYRLFDTATAYNNEADIGSIIKNSDFDVRTLFITSKVSKVVLGGRRRFFYLNKKSVNKAYHESCMRLGVDKVNAYLIHSPFEDCARHYESLMNLYDDGLVDVIGVSNFNIEELLQLKKKCGRFPMMNQTEISPYNNERDLIIFCQDHGIHVQAYSPFGRGLLVQELLNDKILIEIAERYNKSVAAIVLRFIVQQGCSTIPRSSNEDRLKENYNIFDISLSKEDMSSIFRLNKNIVFSSNQINKKTFAI